MGQGWPAGVETWGPKQVQGGVLAGELGGFGCRGQGLGVPSWQGGVLGDHALLQSPEHPWWGGRLVASGAAWGGSCPGACAAAGPACGMLCFSLLSTGAQAPWDWPACNAAPLQQLHNMQRCQQRAV